MGQRKTGASRVFGWVREVSIVVVAALLASTLLRAFVIEMFVVPSGSMENTILPGYKVAAQRLTGFQRGDIVVFRDTLGWLKPTIPDRTLLHRGLVFVGLAPDDSASYLIKRVIAVAGDHVTAAGGEAPVVVNGVALDERDHLYIDPVTGVQSAPSDGAFDVVVPAGTIFVLGDHRDRSADSRCHLDDDPGANPPGTRAFVPVGDIVGTAVAVAYPLDQLRTFARPPAFATIPAGTTPPAEPMITGSAEVC